MLIYLPPAMAQVLSQAALRAEPGSAAYQVGEALEALIPRGTRRLEAQALEDQALEALSQGGLVPGPDQVRQSGGWSSPAEVGFAVDTVREVRRGSQCPAESVDLDRVLDLLYTIRA